MDSETQANGISPIQTRVAQTGVVSRQTRVVTGYLAYKVTSGLGLKEIIVRICCTLFCLGILITGTVAFSGIDLAEQNGADLYENADSHRAVAGWTVFLGSVGTIYNGALIFVCVCCLNAVVQNNFKAYVYTNTILSIVFVPSMLAGGIVNVVYSVDNSRIINPDCLDIDSTDDSAMRDFCSGVSRVHGCEITGGVLCFLSMVCFAILLIFMLYNAHKFLKTQSNSVPLQLKVAPS